MKPRPYRVTIPWRTLHEILAEGCRRKCITQDNGQVSRFGDAPYPGFLGQSYLWYTDALGAAAEYVVAITLKLSWEENCSHWVWGREPGGYEKHGPDLIGPCFPHGVQVKFVTEAEGYKLAVRPVYHPKTICVMVSGWGQDFFIRGYCVAGDYQQSTGFWKGEEISPDGKKRVYNAFMVPQHCLRPIEELIEVCKTFVASGDRPGGVMDPAV